jgi:hypothetical protein
MNRDRLLVLAALAVSSLGWTAPAPAQIFPVAQEAYLKASNTGEYDTFGRTVAASGDTVVVGASAEDSAAVGVNGDHTSNDAPESGAVYVFVRNGATWTQQAYIKAPNTEALDRFGCAVALSGDTLVIGALGEDSGSTGVNGDWNNNGAVNSGAAYVYVRNGTTWSRQAYLKASNTAVTDYFGFAVSISGDTVVVGASAEDSSAAGVNGDQSNNGAGDSGAAYVFVRNGTTWTQQAYLKASNPDQLDHFGEAVCVSDDTIVVGAWGEDSIVTGVNGDQGNDDAADSGAAYVFVRNGTSWTQEAYLKASNTEEDDEFGLAVTLSGDTVVVGARGEDSSATGVNGNQLSSGANGSGAAYAFVRTGGVWSQQAYLKASNSGMNDLFGDALSLSGDTLLVGAQGEFSNATGINGNQANNSAQSAGAGYLFVREGSTWSQQAYLKGSNTEWQDAFGSGVSISGDVLVVGAQREKSSATGVNGDQGNGILEAGAAYVFDLMPGPWTGMGSGLAGVSGTPSLIGSGTLVAGSGNAIDLANAAPSAPAGLFIALSSTPVAFKGGVLLPVPFLAVLSLATSAAGTVPLPFVMPAGVPTGTQLWLQWAVQDAAAVQGVALSNAIRGIAP